MPYIKLEDAKKAIEVDNVHKSIIDAMQSFLDDVPKADVVEVKHGKWIDGEMQPHCTCSVCKHWFSLYDKIPYCPNCGAKMDLEEEAQ